MNFFLDVILYSCVRKLRVVSLLATIYDITVLRRRRERARKKRQTARLASFLVFAFMFLILQAEIRYTEYDYYDDRARRKRKILYKRFLFYPHVL